MLTPAPASRKNDRAVQLTNAKPAALPGILLLGRYYLCLLMDRIRQRSRVCSYSNLIVSARQQNYYVVLFVVLTLTSKFIILLYNTLWLYRGGERGIRTLEGRLTLTPLAGERFQPLSHLSY